MAEPPKVPRNIFYVIAFLSISSLLLHQLSLSSASSPHHFEGFDADELEEDSNSHIPLPSPPPSTTLSSSPPPPPPPISTPDPPTDQSSSSFDYWDEDEFEGLPPPSPPPTQHIPYKTPENSSTPTPSLSNSDLDLNGQLNKTNPKGFLFYYVEIISVSFLVMFLINYFTGKKQNEKLAMAWATRFAGKDSIFYKNFSLLGVGEGDDDSPLLLKEGQSLYKFYASGRKFCQGLLVTLELKSRHDLISRVYDVFVNCKDEMSVEVFMNDDAMDHVVFALARKKEVKAMQKEESDLMRLAGLMAPINGRKWVVEELGVVGESKEVAGDMITEAVLDQVFGDKAFEKLGKYFISMHFSDQHQGSHKKMLTFKFALPDVNHMADMTRLVALVPYYIDLIGRHKLSLHARSKTEAARQKVAQEIHKELLSARQEDLKKRKAEQRKKLEEAEAQLSAEVLRKREAKEHARQLKKAMPKTKMTRK